MANLGRISPLLIDAVREGGINIIPNFGMTAQQEKKGYIQHTSRSQTEPESEIHPSGLNSLTLAPPQVDVDPDDAQVRMETTIIGRMAEHIYHLESQLAAWDGFSEAPPPTYAPEGKKAATTIFRLSSPRQSEERDKQMQKASTDYSFIPMLDYELGMTNS
ncbi:hypothetical protein BDP27DRAFT_1373692 [Rhodocollybia butyracea]|uniref:Uncharacterized protein n=1 Tax=Rhodocollybia butyracea TaxID=206335 RepID=A0A9P5P5N3_9AGAR|nr:hypothetical protein BDP27DRAFT_1373692 [Rhodocollybia butyracea]